MTKHGLKVAIFALLTIAGCGITCLLAISFWLQQGANNPELFIVTTTLAFVAPVAFGYFLAADEAEIKNVPLLHYFAGRAMQAGIGRWGGDGGMHDEGGVSHSTLAKQSYQIARAMIAEGKKE